MTAHVADLSRVFKLSLYGLAMFAGMLCFVYDLWMTWRGAEPIDGPEIVSAGMEHHV